MISREKSANSGLDATPAEWTIGEGGSTRDTCGKVATWKKYNSNLESASESEKQDMQVAKEKKKQLHESEK